MPVGPKTAWLYCLYISLTNPLSSYNEIFYEKCVANCRNKFISRLPSFYCVGIVLLAFLFSFSFLFFLIIVDLYLLGYSRISTNIH